LRHCPHHGPKSIERWDLPVVRSQCMRGHARMQP
jgi:hypothetical protein